MSELKARHVVDVYDDYAEQPCEEHSRVYLKSEADKVIAELEESHKKEVEQLLIEIAELKEKLKVQTSFAEEGWKEFRTYHSSYAEAEKVIAELKHDVAAWMDSYEVSRKTNARTESELRHQKYKRCLAMRNMCRYAQYSYSYLMENESCKIRPNNIDFRRYNKKYHFYIRWCKRWLELAEKFKEGK